VQFFLKAQYSINKGLWDKRRRKRNLNQPLPSDAPFSTTKKGEEKVTLQFEKEN
jgi:hypothetical protein